ARPPLAVWAGFPILVALLLGLTHCDMLNPPCWAGISNYTAIANDPLFWRAMWHNLIIAAVGIPVSMLLALVLAVLLNQGVRGTNRKSTRLNSSHVKISYAVFCLKKKKQKTKTTTTGRSSV